jgi:hypothetical protein
MRVTVERCESCGQTKGAKHKATTTVPDIEQLTRWTFDGIGEATDGCQVEPDGRCEHGHASWLLRLGMI